MHFRRLKAYLGHASEPAAAMIATCKRDTALSSRTALKSLNLPSAEETAKPFLSIKNMPNMCEYHLKMMSFTLFESLLSVFGALSDHIKSLHLGIS